MKRGTGFPQLFSFILIIGIGFVMMIAVFFMRTDDAPVTKNVEEELANFKAHYILQGFLNQKIEGDFAFEDPRRADVILSYDAYNGENSMPEHVRLGLDPYEKFPEFFSPLEKLEKQFSFSVNNQSLEPFEDEKMIIGCKKFGTSTIILPEKKKVTLRICEDSS